MALLLSALGIYGVMAFAIAERRHEIGLRIALGAQQSEIMKLILTEGMKPALLGGALGFAGAYALGRLLHNGLYGMGTMDLASFSAVACLLLAAGLLACYVPARRSTRVDAMVALRQE